MIRFDSNILIDQEKVIFIMDCESAVKPEKKERILRGKKRTA